MKISILVASERIKGNCDILAKYSEKLLKEKNIETSVLYLKDYDIKECRGCMSCVFKDTKCKIEDDIYILAEKIINADGLILFAPTYVLTIPGKLKIFLDRFLCLYPLIKNKPERPALSVGVASPIDWNQFQLPLMNIFLLAFNYRIVDSFLLSGAGPGEVLLDKNIKRFKESIDKLLDFKSKPFNSTISRRCPVDFCDIFQHIKGNLFRCPVCLTEAKIVENGFYFDEKDLNNNRWTKEKMEEHFKEWILKTKDRFRELLPEIYEKKKEFDFI